MVEIRHKETNEQYTYITLDSILDTSCLKDTDGKMRKSLETIYNKSNDIFHWQDDERGTRSCNSLSGSLEYHKSHGRKLTAHLPPSYLMKRFFHKYNPHNLDGSCCECNNVDQFKEFESDWKQFLDPWFQMLGYDEFTIELWSKMNFGQWTVFWDTPAAQSTEDYNNRGCQPHGMWIENDEPIHIDSDEFMWFRVGETFTDDNNNKWGKSLITLGEEQETILFEGYGLLCPGGTWHGPPHNSVGVSLRIVAWDNFFHIQDWYSEEHKKLCEYVKSFTYNVKVVRGNPSAYNWSFVDYSKANTFSDVFSGSWYGKGHKENQPKSIEPFIFE